MNVLSKNPQQTQAEILNQVLDRLSGVIASGDGVKALCPAHADRRPSLSVKEGQRGILLHCWAGCQLSDICRSIGLQESDLFYDEPASRSFRRNDTFYKKANLHYRWNWRGQANELEIIGDCRGLLADDFLRKVQAVDVTHWTDEQRDRLLGHIFTAMKWIEVSEAISELAYQIRQTMRIREGAHV